MSREVRDYPWFSILKFSEFIFAFEINERILHTLSVVI